LREIDLPSRPEPALKNLFDQVENNAVSRWLTWARRRRFLPNHGLISPVFIVISFMVSGCLIPIVGLVLFIIYLSHILGVLHKPNLREAAIRKINFQSG
jgi:hypothetical protein